MDRSHTPSPRPPSRQRQRAPTITVDDVSTAEPRQDKASPMTPVSPATLHDTNTLAVPTLSSSRNDSWGSSISATTRVGSTEGQGPVLTNKTPLSSEDIQKANPDVFKPNPGEDHLFNVENNPFAFTPGHLGKMINPKNLTAFAALGGLRGLEKGLQTDRQAGLSVDEVNVGQSITFEQVGTAFEDPKPHKTPVREATGGTQKSGSGNGRDHRYADRKRIFGDNRLPSRKPKSFLQLCWIALQDHVLILLSIAAVISLALGLYQTFRSKHHEGAKVEWVEGVAIIVAISIVVIVGAANDWQKERQFQKLNEKKEDRLVKVIRSGNPRTISVHDVLVGDIMLLEPGDVIPVDGVFISGHNLSCDESSATGESDLIKKVAADDVLHALLHEEAPRLKKLDPFIISGAKVLDGVGTFLVTGVGQNSSHGQTITALNEDPALTPLQSRLNSLAKYIAYMGSGAGGLLFTVLLIEFLAKLPGNSATGEEKGQNFLRILITSITIIVVAVPEGLPLAVTLSLAFATKKMTRENNLVRHLQSCETMGNATVICSDKTGTLTENVMTVVAGALGDRGQVRFGEAKDSETKENEVSESSPAQTSSSVAGQIPISRLSSELDSDFQDLFKTAIAMNTTAFEGEENGKKVFIGAKTESALLDFARRCFALGPIGVERSNHHIEQLFPFNSSRKCMAAVVKLSGTEKDNGKNKYRVFIKGAPEILLTQCNTSLGDPSKPPSNAQLSDSQKEEIRGVIGDFAKQSLRTLAMAYRDFEQWPPRRPQRADGSSPKEVEFDDIFRDLTWMGVVGIQDPVRKGVFAAVQDCRTASVAVKMVTGDNVETARAIARECGILTQSSEGKEGLVMEGQEFRKLNKEERAAIVRDLCVLARSSPEDKRILVKALRGLGEIVAVTGDGTNDAPALKAADVGFSMGITGTEVAKEASDIILMDDNFSSIIKALGWGRAINDSVKKFLQFQLTVNITAVLVTFISAVSDDEETSVLNAVQLLWVNLIMDTFAALALATDPPTGSLLHRKPEARNASLITLTMWKMIIGQSIYQLIVCFVLWFAGPSFLKYPENELRTLIFNVFVFMQIFKLVNSRRIDNKLNIFEGLHKNHLFMLMMAIMTAGQVIIICFGGDAFVVTKLNGKQWGISVVLGFFSVPIGVLIRLIPDPLVRTCWVAFMKIWPSWLRLPKRKKKEEGDEESIAPDAADYNVDAALYSIKDDLEFLRKVRGGRIQALSEAMARSRELMSRRHRRSRSESRPHSRRASSRSSNRPQIAPMLAVVGMPGIVAASVGGLSPVESTQHRQDEFHERR